MEGLSGTLAGCRGGMRVGLSCWEKGREELTVEQDWGWGQLLFLLRFTDCGGRDRPQIGEHEETASH